MANKASKITKPAKATVPPKTETPKVDPAPSSKYGAKGVVGWQEALKPLRNLVNVIEAMQALPTMDAKLLVSIKAEIGKVVKAMGDGGHKIPGRLARRLAAVTK